MGSLRILFLIVAGMVCASLAPAGLHAESYPDRPIRIVVPYAAGGNSDLIARTFATALSDSLGQSVIVVNRPGASAIIGTEMVAAAPPDGYTLLMISSGNLTTNPALFAKLPYDTAMDLTPITNVASTPYVLSVHPSLPVKSVAQLIRLVKSEPGKITAAIPGVGTGGHLALELFMNMSGTEFLQVPYQGAAPALADTIAGHTKVMMDALSTSLQNVRAGKIRPLAQSGLSRSPLLPDVPTVSEEGLAGYEFTVANALLGPAGMPRGIVDKLRAEFEKAGQRPELQQSFAQLGLTVTVSTPEELAAYIDAETAKWQKIISAAGIARR